MVDVLYINSSKPPEMFVSPAARNEYADGLCRKFMTWLGAAKPRDKFCYYKGRHVSGHTVARAAMDAYEKGHVILFQKRSGDFEFEYWAQKKRRWEY